MNDLKRPNAASGKNSGPLIYVVDDEPMLLELASIVLEPLGYRLQTFRDPDTALKEFTAAKPRPTVIVTDYAMHTMNGMDLIRECKRLQPGQKILLVSGTVGTEIFHDATVKPDRFLAKPYQAKQLADMVAALLAA